MKKIIMILMLVFLLGSCEKQMSPKEYDKRKTECKNTYDKDFNELYELYTKWKMISTDTYNKRLNQLKKNYDDCVNGI